ncbi:hypothetical protein K3495_g10369 [Podosphaera aphanis]|nr:hypothetical protein K3495_g10369 [Podosphaera aphanis]
MNGPADALSRPNGIPDPKIKDFLQRVIKPENLSPGMKNLDLSANDIREEANTRSLNAPTIPTMTNSELDSVSFVQRIRQSTLL